MKCAPDVSDALQVAKQDSKPDVVALLTLIRAAQTDDCNLVASLFQDQLEGSTKAAVLTGDIPVVVPIELARQCGHHAVREELLFRTDVLREHGAVQWHGLHLCALESKWLTQLDWTTHLTLAWNCLKELPAEMACLKRVNKNKICVIHRGTQY